MQLIHNKILITGATSGIGEVLTKKFLSLGNQVIAVGRNKEKLEELKKLGFTFKFAIRKDGKYYAMAGIRKNILDSKN